MIKKIPLDELQSRINRFRAGMDKSQPDWELAIVLSKVNQYYFTGTMQDGMLLIHRDREAEYWVRRSYERALNESCFPVMKPMESYRTVAAEFGKIPNCVHLETEIVPIAMYERIRKHFPFNAVLSADLQIKMTRAIKSRYELSLMEQSGIIHQKVLEERVPGILKEGMSEAELATQLFSIMIEEGHHGIARFGMFDTNMLVGYICFGESSIYPAFFNGPGGNYGMSPAVPSFGSRENKLKKGDLVFIDIGCGVEGYHTDKTMTYVFGGTLPSDVVKTHNKCVEIQNRVADMLKPGIIPADIYKSTIDRLTSNFMQNFMGFEGLRSKFLGHGIGLEIDEYPVIADGFNEPLQEGMSISVEPKKGIKNIGMVGIENTFLVSPLGGKNITGNSKGLIPV